MLRQKLIINISLLHLVGLLSSYHFQLNLPHSELDYWDFGLEFFFALHTHQKTATFLWYALKTSIRYTLRKSSTVHVRSAVNVVPNSADLKVAILMFISAVKN